MAADKFTPEEYVSTILAVAKRLVDEGSEKGLDVEVEWTLPNVLRKETGKPSIDTDEAAKNMGALTVKVGKKVEIR